MCEDGTRRSVGQVLEKLTVAQLWKHAQHGWQGKGLQDGIDTPATVRWHKQLASKGRYSEQGMLEAVMCGGCWSPARIAELAGNPQEKCSRCGL